MLKKSGRAAAPVQLLDEIVITGKKTTLQGDFPGNVTQVLGRTPVVLDDDFVAGAVVADRRAERQVEIQRQSFFFPRCAPGKPILTAIRSQRNKAVSRRIRGIARAVDVKAPHGLRVENDAIGNSKHGHSLI